VKVFVAFHQVEGPPAEDDRLCGFARDAAPP